MVKFSIKVLIENLSPQVKKGVGTEGKTGDLGLWELAVLLKLAYNFNFQ